IRGGLLMYKPNNIILKSTSSIIIFILFGFALYLLLAGHNSPGGGFVGGLTTSAAVLLMFMAYGEKTVNKVLPLNFVFFISLGLLIALFIVFCVLLFNVSFLYNLFSVVDF